MDVLIIIVALAMLIFWCCQFVLLMLMEDGLFPGAYDKLIWGIAFIFIAPLAPIAFVFWRKTTLLIKKQ